MKNSNRFLAMSGGLILITSGLFLGGPLLNTYAHAETASSIPDTNSRLVHVDSSDYANYFTANSGASITGDTALLTHDVENMTGNTVLNTKIDMSQSFKLQGFVNLGNKSQENGGGDGISFVFQPGDTSVIGFNGGAMSFGGVEGAFGFKLDTFFNGRGGNGYVQDPPQFGPEHGHGVSFGAFVDGTSGVATTISNGSQQINEPENNDFQPIDIEYNGTAKVMTALFEDKIWTQDVSGMLGDNHELSFAIASATGTHTNLHEFRLKQFDYTVAQGKVIAHYVNELGESLVDDIVQQGDLDSPWTTEKKDIPGYVFKEVQGDTSGIYTANDQEVTYVYSNNLGKADIIYIDDTTGNTLTSEDFSGNIGDKADYLTEKTIKGYEAQGYDLVSDNYPKEGVILGEIPQHFEVHLKHGITQKVESRIIKQTIHYIYGVDGSKAAEDIIDQVVYRKEVILDKVTGETLEDRGWKTDKDYFSKKVSPHIPDYIAEPDAIEEVKDIKEDSKDIVETVRYFKIADEPIPSDPSNPSNPSDKNNVNDKNINKGLPETGERTGIIFSIIGALGVVLAILLLVIKRKVSLPKK